MKRQEGKDITDETDESLIKRVQKGDDAIFDMVSERYREKLLYYVLRYVHTRDAADDVMQEVFIKAHRNINSFDTTKKFSSWIYTIAHNEAVTSITRKNKKQTVSFDDETLVHKNQSVHVNVDALALERWFQKELREEMRSAIAQLPEKYQDIIRMRFLEDLSYQEISNIIDKPVNTVGTLVRRAKKRLLEIVLTADKNKV